MEIEFQLVQFEVLTSGWAKHIFLILGVCCYSSPLWTEIFFDPQTSFEMGQLRIGLHTVASFVPAVCFNPVAHHRWFRKSHYSKWLHTKYEFGNKMKRQPSHNKRGNIRKNKRNSMQQAVTQAVVYLQAFNWKKMPGLGTLTHAPFPRETGMLVCFPNHWDEVRRGCVLCAWCHYLRQHMRWMYLRAELEWSWDHSSLGTEQCLLVVTPEHLAHLLLQYLTLSTFENYLLLSPNSIHCSTPIIKFIDIHCNIFEKTAKKSHAKPKNT